MRMDQCFMMKHTSESGSRPPVVRVARDGRPRRAAPTGVKPSLAYGSTELPRGAFDFDAEFFEFAIEGWARETKDLRTSPDVP